MVSPCHVWLAGGAHTPCHSWRCDIKSHSCCCNCPRDGTCCSFFSALYTCAGCNFKTLFCTGTLWHTGIDWTSSCAFYKINLRGRLVLNKEDKPYATKDITAKLHKLCKVKGPRHMLSLAREFFEFFFLTRRDAHRLGSQYCKLEARSEGEKNIRRGVELC